METIRRPSLVEITAEHLRVGFRIGRWRGLLPGVLALAAELAVSKDTVRAALQMLEEEGSLQANGAGKCRKIMTRRARSLSRRVLRIALFLPEPLLDDNAHSQRLILTLKSAIEAEGHVCIVMDQIRHQFVNLKRRVTRLVAETAADAWIIYGGMHDLLRLFSVQSIPVLALGGRADDLPIASSRTTLVDALNDCVDALVALGHRRIVLVANHRWRQPTPSINARTLMARLVHHGIPATTYNVPDWEETAEGLEHLLKALFFATPPTALLFTEPSYCVAARAILAEQGLLVPGDVSIVNLMPDPVFHLQRPALAEFEWPERVHVQRILRWVKALQAGKEDREKFAASARFVPGGTLAIAKKSPVSS